MSSRTGWKEEELLRLSVKQLLNTVAMEICIYPDGKDSLDENRVRTALIKLKEMKNNGLIHENVGSLVMDKVKWMLQKRANRDSVWDNLSIQEAKDAYKNALSSLQRLMQEIN